MKGIDDPFPELGSVYKTSGCQVNQLSHNMAKVNLNSVQDGRDNGNLWKSPNRDGGVAAKYWASQESAPNAWGNPNVIQKPGRQTDGVTGTAKGSAWPIQTANSNSLPGSGNAWPQQTNGAWGNNSSHPVLLAATAKPGCDTSAPADCGQVVSHPNFADIANNKPASSDALDVKDYDSDIVNDSDDDDTFDDDVFGDDFDSNPSERSHERRKKSKWFRKFFDNLDKMTVEEINSPARQWHCPACQEGPGAIDWYRGLQPIISHARTKSSRRPKLHRVFADVLEEEMRRRGIPVTPIGNTFGRWEGLNERVKDHDIIWPPMVIIMNTRYEQEENEKWIGMGNQELLNYFSSYAALKARHSYGPHGHRGMSVLIFDNSAAGYLEAARLHKHFKEQGRDRDAWDRCQVPFCPGGKRQLYGYMAVKEDMEIFNRHSQGRSKLKFEMRSYQEMVESHINQINEDSQQLTRFKNKVAKEQKYSQALAESLCRLGERLYQTAEENSAEKQQTKLQHGQSKGVMDAQEQFFKEQIKFIHEAIDAKEAKFGKLQQMQMEKFKLSTGNPSNIDDSHRVEEIARFMKFQDKEVKDFELERGKLIKDHEDKRAALMRRYWEEQVELANELESKLTQLMEKYTPNSPEEENKNH